MMNDTEAHQDPASEEMQGEDDTQDTPKEAAQQETREAPGRRHAVLRVKDRLTVFWNECVRVLKVTKKPTMLEFKTIVKVSGIGMAIIGIIGFLLQFGKELFFRT